MKHKGIERTKNVATIHRCSIVVSIPACHAGDPGSIPGSGFEPATFALLARRSNQLKWLVAWFHLHEGTQYTVAFGLQKNTVIILGMVVRYDMIRGNDKKNIYKFQCFR
ncbi:hypothetical protein MTR_1g047570 [Medicago truncatula]|uniref:Uncharacterized protein n=1 Tax=Medicago truncatula TaxID=3880 RepID=G8A2E2_MEDTR|nr:hypothetical protein MTR_1g047570 [Medicago truncatula]